MRESIGVSLHGFSSQSPTGRSQESASSIFQTCVAIFPRHFREIAIARPASQRAPRVLFKCCKMRLKKARVRPLTHSSHDIFPASTMVSAGLARGHVFLLGVTFMN